MSRANITGSFAFVFTCTAIAGTNLTVDVELKTLIIRQYCLRNLKSSEEVIQYFLSVLGDMLWLDEWKKTARSELAVKRFCFFAHLLSVSLSPQMPFS